jgi:hypothetical protein
MSGAAVLSPWTVVVTGPGGAEVWRSALRTGIPVTIGRAPDCMIMIPTMGIARYMGRIELRNSVPTFVAEPAATGTLLDGDPVDGAAPLGDRTVLEIGGYRISLQRAARTARAPRAAASPGAAPPPDAHAGETLLDRQIVGVRMHRSVSQQELTARAHKWEDDWKTVLASARTIQSRYAAHPQILTFAVSKDEREITIKLREASRRGYAYFCLSRAHPEGKYPDMQAVWLREVGRDDCNFSEPLQGFEELVSRLAPRLA